MVALDRVPREVAEPMALLLGPMAPHMSEELWHRLGHAELIAYQPWPTYDESQLVEDTIELPVQINGKVRAKINVAADADNATVEAVAKADEKVAAAIADKTVRKVIVVPGRMVNIVVS